MSEDFANVFLVVGFILRVDEIRGVKVRFLTGCFAFCFSIESEPDLCFGFDFPM